MRKLLALLMVLMLTLTACSGSPFADDKDMDEDGTVDETDEDTEDTDEDEGYDYGGETSGGGTATIEFYDPVEISSEGIVESHREYYLSNMPEYYGGDSAEQDYLNMHINYSSFWSAGTFTSGEYAGRNLVIAEPACDGPCLASFYRFAADIEADEWALLANYSDEWNDWTVIFPYSSMDTETEIPQLAVPETLDAYENDITYLTDPRSNSYEYFEEYGAATSIADDSFDAYFKSSGCIYAQMPDGVMAKYMVVPEDFYSADEDYGVMSTDLKYSGLDGISSTKSYALAAGKCGFASSCLASFEATDETNLVEVGSFPNTTLYMLENPEDVEEDFSIYDYESFEYQLLTAYSSYKSRVEYSEGGEPGSMEEFVSDHNVFFLQLDNGNYVLVYNSDYAPMAECGKPVIYLYPEEETEVNVQVGIDEFTVTDPVYGEDGWNVIAQPDSTLTNLADNLVYPYLFWEGTSEKELTYEPGWTLTKKEVVKVLPKVLTDMGLNQQETEDFMEFWQPRLLEEPGKYVEFSFVPKTAFDEVAPLTITPTPDQVIRIFMIYKGTNQKGLPVPDYATPKRYGFTVVEWGGDLH